MKIIAHRGIHDTYLENSYNAFQEAIKYNKDIELDVMLTKDYQIIVFHDLSLKRLFNNPSYIHNLSYEYLNKYYKIPTLKEILNLVKGKVTIYIEIKSIKFNSKIEMLIKKELDNYTGNVYIMSFNIASLFWFKQNAPKYKRGYLIYSLYDNSFIEKLLLNKIILNLILKPNFIAVSLSSLDNKKIRNLSNKYQIYGYTLKTKKEYEKYHKYTSYFFCDYNNKEIAPLRTISQKE